MQFIHVFLFLALAARAVHRSRTSSVHRSRTILAILVEGHQSNISSSPVKFE